MFCAIEWFLAIAIVASILIAIILNAGDIHSLRDIVKHVVSFESIEKQTN